MRIMEQVRRVGQHAVIFAELRQEALGDWFEEKLGTDYRFDVDNDLAQFEFSSARGSITARARLIASVAPQPPSALWAFAPMFAAYPTVAELGPRIRAFGAQHELPDFTASELPFDLAETGDAEAVIAEVAHDLGRAAVEIFGAEYVYYSAPTGSTRLVYLLDRWSIPPPRLELSQVAAAMPRLALLCDDVAWSLDGLARLAPEWRVERAESDIPQRQAYTLTDQEGLRLAIDLSRDTSGRISEVNVRADPGSPRGDG